MTSNGTVIPVVRVRLFRRALFSTLWRVLAAVTTANVSSVTAVAGRGRSESLGLTITTWRSKP
jgi:hypothetical protein